MEKRVLGKTGFEVSVIGFGGIPIQRVDEETAYELLVESYNQGINFIDTARGYMESENLLGAALERFGRNKFILATKSMARTYDGVIEELNTSLKNLRTDYIDLFQFHNVRTKEDLDTVMGENGALKAIKEYKEKGIIKEIGITSHSVDILDIAIDTGEFSTIQYPYNPVERQGEPVFKKAKANNIGVIIMKPLAGGAIPKGELCLRFILENDDVTVAIPGMDSIEQVRENTKAGQDRRSLTPEERKDLEEEAKTLGSEFCRRCGYCAPCTVGIDIPSQFIMEGYYTRYNLQDWAKSRYEAMTTRAKDCIECGDCETRCPYDLPIIKMLKRVESNLG
ncbi:aldo/keto reductase [Wansuia hejianensis]|uniref:Aldo/keto reductase n=1 Tax=Wansuia hejianensis TaxID=2763667 RepID=A0A926IH28_9FIRM|nr:aldo/keto reductase [Wansuia hejianensis]MBC8590202.1 aldo/keto reductase [Wansuia hejianensis]